MYISNDEKELLLLAISALQQLYARIDDSVEEEKLIARASNNIANTSPLNKINGLNFLDEEVTTESPPRIFQGKKGYIYKFSLKELKNMSKDIRVLFQNQSVCAHMRTRQNGYLELRARINGKDYSGTGKDEKTAVEHFIAALNRESDENPANGINKNISFEKYAQIWLETAIKPSIKEVTYSNYVRLLDNHILPKFGKRRIVTIKQFELQKFLNGIVAANKARTAQMVYQLLAAIFSYAVIDGIFIISPMAKIKKPRHQAEHGVPLSPEEESRLVADVKKGCSVYVQAFAFLVYTGLRRSELASVVVKDDWVHLITSKQHKGSKEKPRSVPVSPMLADVLPYIDVAAIVKISGDVLTRRFKEYLPNHHLHDTRHTFITRCQECGVRREIVSLWAGHSADSSITSLVYTHLEQNKSLQIEEILKVKYRLN